VRGNINRLIGYGCAATCYPTQMAPAAARVRLQRDGRARVEIAGHEIGNGAYTVIGQAAAEKLGVPVEKVTIFIGDSNLPPAPVAGGSNSTASTCSTVIMVCEQIRQKLFKALIPNESLVDKAKETVGLGQTPSTQAASSDQSLDIERHSMRSVSARSRNTVSGSPMARQWIHSAPCITATRG
jgi:xanthine dehydrogenase YagR molybdenum-binding subunit